MIYYNSIIFSCKSTISERICTGVAFHKLASANYFTIHNKNEDHGHKIATGCEDAIALALSGKATENKHMAGKLCSLAVAYIAVIANVTQNKLLPL